MFKNTSVPKQHVRGSGNHYRNAQRVTQHLVRRDGHDSHQLLNLLELQVECVYSKHVLRTIGYMRYQSISYTVPRASLRSLTLILCDFAPYISTSLLKPGFLRKVFLCIVFTLKILKPRASLISLNSPWRLFCVLYVPQVFSMKSC